MYLDKAFHPLRANIKTIGPSIFFVWNAYSHWFFLFDMIKLFLLFYRFYRNHVECPAFSATLLIFIGIETVVSFEPIICRHKLNWCHNIKQRLSKQHKLIDLFLEFLILTFFLIIVVSIERYIPDALWYRYLHRIPHHYFDRRLVLRLDLLPKTNAEFLLWKQNCL